MVETQACAIAIAGCREACPRSHLMCIRHWRMVPAPLQRAVGEAFRRWRGAVGRARKGCTEETFNAATALRKVQEMAINAVIEKEVQRDLKRQEGQDPLFS